jgi:Subtilase family
MRFFHGAPRRMYRSTRQVACAVVLLVLSLVLIAGCKTTATRTPTPTPTAPPCTTPTPKSTPYMCQPVSFWVPGIFLVGLVSNRGALPQGMTDVPANVTSTIKALLSGTGLGLTAQDLTGLPSDIHHSSSSAIPPALMVFDQPGGAAAPEVAIATYQLVSAHTDATDTNDTDLITAVNVINSAIENNHNLCVDVTSTGSTGSCTVWLAGATPDLAALGGDLGHTGGSPGGSPTPGTASVWMPLPNGVGPTSGSGKNIYVLDTALNVNNIPSCLNPPGGGTGCDFLNLPESSFSLPDQVRPEAYADQGTMCDSTPASSRCSFVRHGEFVAKIIQHVAPGATLYLKGVLDNYGAADVRSLIYGLYQVLMDQVKVAGSPDGSHTIVNLSLTIEPPTECLPAIWQSETNILQTTAFANTQRGNYLSNYPEVTFSISGSYLDCTSWNLMRILRDGKVARLYVPIGLVMQQLTEDKYTLVAAAGNDSGSGTRYGADMPAAFCGVYAVAASSINSGSPSTTTSGLAPFSNRPAVDGTNCMQVPVTFTAGTPDVMGAPISSQPSSTSAYAPGAGICSFYDDNSYPRGMGIWDGTSFAAPLVSGYLADSSLPPLPTTPDSAADWQPCS